jgi:hypothetical protein
VRIRDATTADTAALAPLLGDLEHPADARAVGERLVALGDDTVLVAEDGGDVLGLAVVHLMALLERPRVDELDVPRAVAQRRLEDHRRAPALGPRVDVSEVPRRRLGKAGARPQPVGHELVRGGDDRGDAVEQRDPGGLERGRGLQGRRVGGDLLGEDVRDTRPCSSPTTRAPPTSPPAVGTASVTIFLSGDPVRWAHGARHPVARVQVECNPCEHLECPIDHRCAQRLPAEDGVRAALGLLRGDAARERVAGAPWPTRATPRRTPTTG